ncbi:MAG: thioredoxin [Hydrogenophilales bacterium 28-61-11]|nr:MAG: thioredoxin [Hydrogenophilales bacterium 28-61-11]
MLTYPMKYAKPAALIAVVLIVVAALAYAMLSKPAAPTVTFVTLEGQPIQLDSLRGKVVLVNFWATSCPGCIKEMPGMVETYNQYKAKGFEIIAVAMSYDPPSHVVNFTQTRQLPFPVALDVKGDLALAFGDVKLTPTSFIVGKTGQILEQKIGELDFVKLRKLLDQELS